MSKEKEPKKKTFNIYIDGVQCEATPANTMAFLHEEEKYDHLFYITGYDETTEELRGKYLWRWDTTDELFIKTIYFMANNGYEVRNQELLECDKEAYDRRFPELPRRELTTRQESKVQYLGYLLAKDLLKPADFASERKSIL